MTWPSPTKTWHSAPYPSIDPKRPELSMAGKVVFITGGGYGIGPQIAHAFATAGSTSIALIGRTASTLSATAASLKSTFPNIKVLALVADVVDKAAVEAAFTETKAKLGPIDILVSNAGYFSKHEMVKDADVDEWWKGFEINVKGSFIVVQAFLKNMTKDAIILHVTAGGAHIPAVPALSSYASSKLASIKFFEYVAAEYPQVRVMNVHPGVLSTEMGAKGRAAGMTMSFDDSKLSPSAAVDHE
jgi:NAD(P)-dependent dehydrogenase (short-subunit alcohol dehydrogenase family)